MKCVDYEDDDDEFSRYLASYLVNNTEKFLIISFDGYSTYINKNNLQSVIKEFIENLP